MEKCKDCETRMQKIISCIPSHYTNEEKEEIALLLIDLADIYMSVEE